ncbi:MAG: OmpA family protein [Methylobacter sp.]
MKTNQYFPLALLAVAIAVGCTAMPQNPSLAAAHNSYNSALTNPEVTNLAALELQEAGTTLNKADEALSKDEDEGVVNQLAYIAKQQVGIAQETAKRKTAELAVTNAEAKRNEVRLDARTAEADSANQKLAIANINAEHDQALIAQQEMQLQALNAKKTERGMVITLSDVLFSTNKAQLKSGGIRNVQKLADFLTQYPEYKVFVEGYTDSTGSIDYNQELSDRRAYTVQTALLNTGVSGDRITARGYGEGFPVAGNDNAVNRQLNRRVEIIFSDNNGNIAPR